MADLPWVTYRSIPWAMAICVRVHTLLHPSGSMRLWTMRSKTDCKTGIEIEPKTFFDKEIAEVKKAPGLWLYFFFLICNVAPILKATSSWNAATCAEIGITRFLRYVCSSPL